MMSLPILSVDHHSTTEAIRAANRPETHSGNGNSGDRAGLLRLAPPMAAGPTPSTSGATLYITGEGTRATPAALQKAPTGKA